MEKILFKWISTIALFLATSCSNIMYEPDVDFERSFMSAEEVSNEFKIAESGKMMMDGKLDDVELERSKNLIPMGVFIPESKNGSKQNWLIKAYGLKPKEIKADFSNYPESVDLRKWDTPIKRQWNGTCTTFAGMAAIEHMLKAPDSLDLSERDSWNHYGKYSCSAFVRALSNARVCDEKNWPQGNQRPYSSCAKNRHAGMIKTKFISNSKIKAVDSLSRGNPVYVGMATPRDMIKCYKVIRSLSKAESGGHALLITGYRLDDSVKGGGYYILKNSWGASCADRGYQYLPFAYCDDADRTWCRMWEVSAVSSTKFEPVKPDPILPEPRKARKVCKGFWFWKSCKWVYD